jgi:hypothetical protein
MKLDALMTAGHYLRLGICCFLSGFELAHHGQREARTLCKYPNNFAIEDASER